MVATVRYGIPIRPAAHPTRNSLHLLAVPPVAADAINSTDSLSLLKEPKVFFLLSFQQFKEHL